MGKQIKKAVKAANEVLTDVSRASKGSNSLNATQIKRNQALSEKPVQVKQYEVEDGINQWLGESTYSYQPIRSEFDMIKLGLSGITKTSVDSLAQHLGISRKSMAEDILDVSVKTLERKAGIEKLDKKISSHAIEIARLMQHTYQVFEEKEKVKRWLNFENKALNGMKPIELLGTLTGLNMVNDVLSRIEEGVYS